MVRTFPIRSVPLAPLLALALLPAASVSGYGDPAAEGLAGEWQGRLMGQMRLVLRFSGSEAAWTGTLDSPDQGAMGITLADIVTRGESLFVAVPSIRGAYAARRVGPDSLDGEWRQSGMRLALAMGRGAPPAPRRPQEPQGALPYDAEEVTIDAGGAVRLAGTLTLPREGRPHPAVLLVSGSGPQNRDEEVFGHRPFLVLADHLTRRGFAVLRVDDRGVGGSTGAFAGATSDDFARDATACVAWLRARDGVDRHRVGLIGHSEGGLIAPMVAARDSTVAFVVLLAGPAVGGEAILLDQNARLRLAAGADSGSIEPLLARQRRLFAEIARPDTTDLAGRIRPLIRDALETLPAADRARITDLDPLIETQTRQMGSPWMRFFLRYDPRPALEQLRCPVLALFGERDLQVAPALNLEPMRHALRDCPDADVVALPGLNHLLQRATTGLPSEYPAIETTIDPAALERIDTWLAARAPAAAGAQR